MKRILAADLHRLFRSFEFYSIIAVIFGVSIIAFFTHDGAAPDVTTKDVFADVTMLFSHMMLLALNLVLISQWDKESKHGYIKNLAGNVNGRCVLTSSKLITGMIGIVVYLAVTFLAVIVGDLGAGSKLVGGPLGDSAVTIGLWMLAGLASNAFFLMLYELTHSLTLGFIVSIALWTGLLEDILRLPLLIANIDFDLPRYMLVSGMSHPENSSMANLVRNLLFIAVFTAAATFIAHKKDVKA